MSTMYAQTDIHCDGEVFKWGDEVSEGDFGDNFDSLVEAGAVKDVHPAIAGNPAAIEALQSQGEQFNLTRF